MLKLETKKQLSRIYIDGKRLGPMTELVEATFPDSFLSIEVQMPEEIFLLRLSNNVDVKKVKIFSEEYPLCKIEIFPRIEMIIFKGKVQLIPAR